MIAILDSKLLAYNMLYRNSPLAQMFLDAHDYINMLPEDVTDIFMVYDNGKSQYRLSLWGGYKGTRSYQSVKVDDHVYLNDIPRLAKALGCHNFMPLGVEADDVGGILAARLKEGVVVITGDHDWMQLPLQYANVWYFNVKTKELLGQEDVRVFTGCDTAEQFLVKKAVLGDSSDNLIGIPRVGQVKFKTWAKEAFTNGRPLKDQFLELCRKHAKDGMETHHQYQLENIHSCEELYELNMKLGRIMTDLSLLTVNQQAHMKAGWAHWRASRGMTFDEAEAHRLYGEASGGKLGPFGDPLQLPGHVIENYRRWTRGS